MTRIIRAALTETVNAYADMPARVQDVEQLAGRLDDVRDANLEHHADLIAAAAGAGVQVICLGELFSGPYFGLHRHPLWRDLAEHAVDGPSVRAMRDAAAAHGVIVIAPIYELDPLTGRRFNTAVIIDQQGEVLGRYRKTHIPEGSNERAAFHETFYYQRGDGELGDWSANVGSNPHYPVFETSVGRIGVAICYDRHFEGVMRSLAAGGAEVVFSPAVTFGEKSRRMWDLEFAVDAARHNLYIGGSNRLGSEAPWGVEFFGASHFAGPDGQLPPVDAPANLAIADLDLGALAGGDGSGWDLPRDARPEIYTS
ncbi:MAG: acyltransferase [Planctomycetota bacterium]|nr:MAG: acyltransferase [Planctomycetota bacterium]